MKKILSAIVVGLLSLGLVAGFGIALAHGGDSIFVDDNSGPGSVNSGRDELDIDELEDLDEIRLDVIGDVADPELEIKNGGDVEIKDAAVASVGTDSFKVVLFGITFKVMVSAATEFNGDLMLADLLEGDIVGVEGMLDMLDHHVIHADEVDILGL